ncbi:MAG: hypothetical protein EA409_08790 [Saprospirales bacterium]|nr:MAG: hypothetical protein EA409_08790 [Saprospirales bacterium]
MKMQGSYFLEWKLRRRLKRRKPYKGKNSAQKVLILFASGDPKSEKEVTHFANELNSQGKSVQLFSWFSGPKSVLQKRREEAPFPIVSKSELNWFGVPTGEHVKSLLSQKFDILYNFDVSGEPFLHYIAGSSDTAFKVGLDMNREEIYDFLVEMVEPKDVRDGINLTKRNLKQIFSI